MMSEIIGSLIIFVGSVFLLLASIGVLRMPDCYNRIQTGTKATTLGLMLVLLGVTVYHPGWGWKLLVLAFFVLLTNPVSSHALAKAAHKSGISMACETVVDQLREEDKC
jgi:multicomponent Na+:H+ antiporter subunit G